MAPTPIPNPARHTRPDLDQPADPEAGPERPLPHRPAATSVADICSAILACFLSAVDIPQRYFAHLLARVADGWPQGRIDELMPWHWAAEAGR